MKPTARQAVRTAYANVGYKAGKGKRNKFAAYIDSHYPTFYNGKKQGVDYCDIFVDYCVLYNARSAHEAEYVLCQPAMSCGAGCRWSYLYYKQKHRNTSVPHYGDQVFFSTGGIDGIYHTGIVYKVDNKYIWYIAANEGVGNGEVKKHKLLRTNKKIFAYGRPRYGT